MQLGKESTGWNRMKDFQHLPVRGSNTGADRTARAWFSKPRSLGRISALERTKEIDLLRML